MRINLTSAYARLLWALLPLLLVLGACGDDQQTELRKQMEKRNEEQKIADDALIKKYLQDNNITNFTQTPSGLHIVYLSRGASNAAQPQSGKGVTTKYTGNFISTGRRFDSSIDKSPDGTFVTTVSPPPGLIEGWYEALTQHMRKGDRVLLLVPSHLAYGASGFAGSIPSYTALMFDLELVDVAQ